MVYFEIFLAHTHFLLAQGKRARQEQWGAFLDYMCHGAYLSYYLRHFKGHQRVLFEEARGTKILF